MSSFNQKLMISIFSAVLFILVSLPATYNLTNSVGLNTYSAGCPTYNGLLLHSFVFFLLSFLSMWSSNASTGLKVKFSLYGTLIFFLISSPAMYSLTSSLFGNSIANGGCPTTTGIILHALVYCAALVGVMYLPNEE
ncbi:MAG: hypothetical protein MUO21_12210 [Nitrososphaeraceae archaeon]|nr:hypothetical protein [Nitrososphaeraceae archaeon]